MSPVLFLALALLPTTPASSASSASYGGLSRAPGAARYLIGAAADEADLYPEVGHLLSVKVAGSVHSSCSATLVAPDVLLTAAHCLPEQMDEGGFFRPERSASRLVWVSATRPVPLGRQRSYEVVSGARLPGYDPNFWRLYVSPLLGRYPHTDQERDALAAYEDACGDGERLFDMQARLRCLAGLPAALQRALGFADASWSANDVGLLFLDRPVTGLTPLRMARPPAGADASPASVVKLEVGQASSSASAGQVAATGPSAPLPPDDGDNDEVLAPAPEGSAVTIVGYGWSQRTPSLSWVFVQPWGTRRASAATVYTVGHHQMQLEEVSPICYGDSGGPVLQRAPDGAWQVVGVSSAMLPLSGRLCGTHATYMRADVVRGWVEATMAAACADGRRSAAGCVFGLR